MKYRLRDVCTKITSGGTPKSTNSTYYGGHIPWLRTQEINFADIVQTELHITEKGLNNSSAKWIPANSVIVAMYGVTAGKSAINKIPLTTNQACCNLIVDDSKADFQYVYYQLKLDYEKIAGLANGGAQQNLNVRIISDYEIDLPDLPAQRAIAKTLSIIDDKIVNNSKINHNLEQIAQTIFKSWFVDFDFPDQEGIPYKTTGGKMQYNNELGIDVPLGWKSGTINDLCKSIASGGTPKRMEHMYWDGAIAWFKTGELTDGPLINSEEHITQEGLEKSACKLWGENTI
ncbi:MAG: restriction endonuclease subunit S [Candidatus Bathyarchaeota archaeon]|nr:restriction endonuclease subunit S [Candidatus Termiticorpusculum sp.]MCL1970331.1 restriction endonuclease subunit S [Candidatus Termiticorpusculum sp.]